MATRDSTRYSLELVRPLLPYTEKPVNPLVQHRMRLLGAHVHVERILALRVVVCVGRVVWCTTKAIVMALKFALNMAQRKGLVCAVILLATAVLLTWGWWNLTTNARVALLPRLSSSIVPHNCIHL